MDPITKVLLTLDIGDRTLAMAQRVVHQVGQGLAPGGGPRFWTEGFKEYTTALLTHFGSWVPPPRRQATGPRPKPRWRPRPQRLSTQVVKTVRRRRLVRVSRRGVFGTWEAVHHVLVAPGWPSNTAFVERLNLAIRQQVAAVGRRVNPWWKHEAGLRQQLVLYQVYHHFVWPHASWRRALAEPAPTHGTGSAQPWRPCTPAMAAELTAQVWTLREVLLCRGPPWPQPVGV